MPERKVLGGFRKRRHVGWQRMQGWVRTSQEPCRALRVAGAAAQLGEHLVGCPKVRGHWRQGWGSRSSWVPRHLGRAMTPELCVATHSSLPHWRAQGGQQSRQRPGSSWVTRVSEKGLCCAAVGHVAVWEHWMYSLAGLSAHTRLDNSWELRLDQE